MALPPNPQSFFKKKLFEVSGRRFVCHDDLYILNLASETGAIVVSNDNYRELVQML
jgi:hypothetical protein